MRSKGWEKVYRGVKERKMVKKVCIKAAKSCPNFQKVCKKVPNEGKTGAING